MHGRKRGRRNKGLLFCTGRADAAGAALPPVASEHEARFVEERLWCPVPCPRAHDFIPQCVWLRVVDCVQLLHAAAQYNIVTGSARKRPDHMAFFPRVLEHAQREAHASQVSDGDRIRRAEQQIGRRFPQRASGNDTYFRGRLEAWCDAVVAHALAIEGLCFISGPHLHDALSGGGTHLSGCTRSTRANYDPHAPSLYYDYCACAPREADTHHHHHHVSHEALLLQCMRMAGPS